MAHLCQGAGKEQTAWRSYPGKSLKPMVMAFYCFHSSTPSIPPIPVHLESHVLRYRSLSQGADEEISKLLGGPFCRRGAEKPFSKMRKFGLGHGDKE